MSERTLIDAIVRQTVILIAQLATAGGVRAPLAHLAALSFFLGTVGFAACATTHDDLDSNGETHFLTTCDAACGGGLACGCAVCTTTCNQDADCARFGAQAKCVTSCKTNTKTCDAPCNVDADCTPLGSGFSCEGGKCRTGSDSVHSDGGPRSRDAAEDGPETAPPHTEPDSGLVCPKTPYFGPFGDERSSPSDFDASTFGCYPGRIHLDVYWDGWACR